MTPALLKQTIDVWQPYSGQPLTDADAGEAVGNVLAFLSVLRRWQNAEADAMDGESRGRRAKLH